jgi:hypothetical protein
VTQRTTRRYIPEDGTLQEKNGSLESKHEWKQRKRAGRDEEGVNKQLNVKKISAASTAKWRSIAYWF